MRTVKEFVFEGFRLGARKFGLPFILTDDLGLRVVIYPWETTPTWKLRGRYNLRKEFMAFDALISEGGIVVDIGAHVGLHSMMLARRAGTVYAFEPTPVSYGCLLENITLNKSINVIPIPKAVTAHTGTQTLNLFSQESSQLNSLGTPDTGETIAESLVVKTVSLDDFAEAEKISHFDFIKIDAEGAELDILRGATKLLKEKRIKCFSFETAQNQFDGVSKKPEDARDFIMSFGYTIRCFDKMKKEFLPLPLLYNPIHDNLYAFAP